MIKEFESRFLEVTGLQQELEEFPITQLVQFPIRKELSKSLGEVFTPPMLVDKMLLISKPLPDKFNIDLCAGRGQFTIRMLRYFYQQDAQFDIDFYLKTYHWFNEFNPQSAKELLYIFGSSINLAVGPAQELSTYPQDNHGIWKRGIYIFHKEWIKTDTSLKYKELKSTSLF